MRLITCLLLLTLTPASPAVAQATDPVAAWNKVLKAMRPPERPKNTVGRLMTATEMRAYRALQAESSALAADLAEEFAKNFPTHENAPQARLQCQRLLNIAVRGGLHDRAGQLRRVEELILQHHNLSLDERYALRRNAVERDAAIAQVQKGPEAMLEVYEKGARQLQSEFPNRPDNMKMLYAVATRSTGEKARRLAAEVARGGATPELRQSALTLMRQVERIDKPLRLEFEDLTGRKIKTAEMRGKVILLDFWATWCGPCVTEIPKLKGLYAKYHEEGLEIIGINADVDKRSLEAMIEYKKIPWPQFFDEENPRNRIKESLGVNDLPTQWLIDRRGRLRTTNARANREELVKKLLAEPAP